MTEKDAIDLINKANDLLQKQHERIKEQQEIIEKLRHLIELKDKLHHIDNLKILEPSLN
jgi:hypothetical protein